MAITKGSTCAVSQIPISQTFKKIEIDLSNWGRIKVLD